MPRTRTPTARRTPCGARRRDADQRRDLLARQPAARRRARRRLDRLDAHLRAQRALAAQRLARDRARELLDVQRLADHEALDRLADLLGEARHVHALVRRVEVDRALELRRVEALLAAVRDADDALDPGHPGARQRDAHARGGGLHVVPQRDVIAGGPAHAPDRTRVAGGSSTATCDDRRRDQSPAPRPAGSPPRSSSTSTRTCGRASPGLAEGGRQLPDDAEIVAAPGDSDAAATDGCGRAHLRRARDARRASRAATATARARALPRGRRARPHRCRCATASAPSRPRTPTASTRSSTRSSCAPATATRSSTRWP